MSKLVDVLFDCCTHARYSFPISVRAGQRRPKAAGMTRMYVVCVDCGKEFAYRLGRNESHFREPCSVAVPGSSAASTWERYGAAEHQLVEHM